MKISTTQWRSRSTLVAIALALLIIGALAGRALPSSDYARRNGAAEALGDFAAGQPAKLYRHSYNQIGPGSRTPGLYCPPPGVLEVESVDLSEAAWSEGRRETFDEMRMSEKARAFAYSYNMTMYNLHRSAWRRACSRLIVEPYQLQLP